MTVLIGADSEAVQSGESLTLTIRVTDGLNSVSNANVTLFSDKGGVFSRKTGETNSTGHFVTVFTAPAVTEKTEITITVKVSKTGYWDGQNWLELNVLLKSVTIGIDFIWVLAAIALTVILIFSVLKLLKIIKKTNSVRTKVYLPLLQSYKIIICWMADRAFKEKPIMLEGLKDFLRIFTWKELWIMVGCAFLVVGAWVFICFALRIPNDAARTIALWGFIFLLSVLGGVTEKSRKKAVSR